MPHILCILALTVHVCVLFDARLVLVWGCMYLYVWVMYVFSPSRSLRCSLHRSRESEDLAHLVADGRLLLPPLFFLCSFVAVDGRSLRPPAAGLPVRAGLFGRGLGRVDILDIIFFIPNVLFLI